LRFDTIIQSKSTRAIIAIFRFIPRRIRKNIFAGLCLIFYYLVQKQRLITLHNLSRAFPEKNMHDIEKIAKKMYRNLGFLIAEFTDIPFLSKEYLAKYVDIEGLKNLREALKLNKGILLFSAHFGNWELAAAIVALILRPLTIIYRKFDSPVVENFVTWVRASAGVSSLSKENAMRHILYSLRNNETVLLLIDQNVAWQEGVFVDFFGMSACTTSALARIAMHTRAPVLPIFMIGLADGRHKLIIGDIMKTSANNGRDMDVLFNTQKYTEIIEDMVRQHPDQWLWIHQRWKTKACQVIKKTAVAS
jgi:Kdo2-lipid IVA lauroyltransferase/acyltransferase